VSTVDAVRAARAAVDAIRGDQAVASAVVVGGPEGRLGARMLVWPDRVEGSLGDRETDAAVRSAARDALLAGSAPTVTTIPTSAGDTRVYMEVHAPTPSLVIVGAGHIARPLCAIGAGLGFAVTVLDDRPAFATTERFPEAVAVERVDFGDPFRSLTIRPSTHLVLVTRGHRFDFDALRIVLRGPVEPTYIGMVGSQRRVRAALAELSAEGIDPERLRRIHAPIGLDIGAETPEEIAVAVAAEIVLLRRGGSGRPLRERARVMERWIDAPGGPGSGPPDPDRRTAPADPPGPDDRP
jgi:xanthine dehydrogenase accessory factor